MDFGRIFGSNKNFNFNQFYTRTSAEWDQFGKRHTLKLFRTVAKHVPAYKDFLARHNIRPAKIKTWKDFQQIPMVDKNNYLRKYPLEKLCWGGHLSRSLVLTSSSGSTGKPFYFPRDEVLDEQSAYMHELFLRSSGLNINKPALVIVCFGMGVWIGGLITYSAFKKLSNKEFPHTLITPGSNKKEIFEVLKSLGNKYRQVILCGYPPFIKDVIDEAEDNNIDWKSFDLKIVFAAEAFSEKFRDYIYEKTGMKNPFTQTMNIYGSADLGTMAEETPLAILARRMAVNDSNIYKELFGDINRLPTLTQFNPLFTNFEIVKNEIAITAYNALPLVRYAIGDHGGVMTFDDLARRFKNNTIDILKKAKSLFGNVPQLPFVYVYERSDYSTKLYGAIIYVEPIREALQERTLSADLTGKFSMQTKCNRKYDEYLEIHIELKPRKKALKQLAQKVQRVIIQKLLEKNAEYTYLYSMMPDRVLPKIILLSHEHPAYFKVGSKQKWVRK